MKLPVDVAIRQDEMRRARVVRRESEPRGEPAPVPREDLRLSDDCAEILLAWWAAHSAYGHAVMTEDEAKKLATRFRRLGRTRG